MRQSTFNRAFTFVGVPGIEPGLHEPESCVIPLYHTPYFWTELGGLKIPVRARLIIMQGWPALIDLFI